MTNLRRQPANHPDDLMLWCDGHSSLHHHKQFRHRTLKTEHGTVFDFFRSCRRYELDQRNAIKNEDRASAIVLQRATALARKGGVTADFVMKRLGWERLIPLARLHLSEDGICLDCGEPFLNERDMQVEHREPARGFQDWPRHHARNIAFICATNNNFKNNRPFAAYLDDQWEIEEAVISHNGERRPPTMNPLILSDSSKKACAGQGSLFA